MTDDRDAPNILPFRRASPKPEGGPAPSVDGEEVDGRASQTAGWERPTGTAVGSPSSLRLAAFEWYKQLRASGEGVDRALSLIGLRAHEVSHGELDFGWAHVIADEEGWERSLTALRTTSLLSSPLSDLREDLKRLLTQKRIAQQLLDAAALTVDGPPPLGWMDNPENGPWPPGGVVGEWKAARNDWLRISRECDEIAQKVARLDQEGPVGQVWRAASASLLESYRAQYGDGGPQYESLLGRLVSIELRLKAAESGGRDVPPEEYRQMHELHLKYLAQIQRHTESLKSESVQPVKDAIMRLVKALEREIKPNSPDVWADVVRVLVQEVEQHGLGLQVA